MVVFEKNLTWFEQKILMELLQCQQKIIKDNYCKSVLLIIYEVYEVTNYVKIFFQGHTIDTSWIQIKVLTTLPMTSWI